jgi:hypothetical protein
LYRSFVFMDILALFPKKHLSTISFQLPAMPFQDGADPDVWGLRCPEGTGQADRHNLTELRLRRIADVRGQRLRQPPTTVSPFSSEEGSHKFPSFDKEGSGVVDCCTNPLFSWTFSLCSPRNISQQSAFSFQPCHSRMAQTPLCGACDVPKGQGRRNLSARSVRASKHPTLAYRFRCSLPRDFPLAGDLGASTDSLKGWRGPEHLGGGAAEDNVPDTLTCLDKRSFPLANTSSASWGDPVTQCTPAWASQPSSPTACLTPALRTVPSKKSSKP